MQPQDLVRGERALAVGQTEWHSQTGLTRLSAVRLKCPGRLQARDVTWRASQQLAARIRGGEDAGVHSCALHGHDATETLVFWQCAAPCDRSRLGGRHWADPARAGPPPLVAIAVLAATLPLC